MSLSLGSDDSFNLYLQKSIARWEPSFSEVFFWIQAWQLFHTYLLLITQRLRKIIFTNTMTLLLTYSNLLCFTSMSSTFALRCFGEARGTSCSSDNLLKNWWFCSVTLITNTTSLLHDPMHYKNKYERCIYWMDLHMKTFHITLKKIMSCRIVFQTECIKYAKSARHFWCHNCAAIKFG